jgi:hypothetical protein
MHTKFLFENLNLKHPLEDKWSDNIKWILEKEF